MTNVTSFGVFVDVGAQHDGLVHVSQLGPARGAGSAQALQPGDRVEVRVLKVDLEKKQVSFTMRPQPQRKPGPSRKPSPRPAARRPAAVAPSAAAEAKGAAAPGRAAPRRRMAEAAAATAFCGPAFRGTAWAARRAARGSGPAPAGAPRRRKAA